MRAVQIDMGQPKPPSRHLVIRPRFGARGIQSQKHMKVVVHDGEPRAIDGEEPNELLQTLLDPRLLVGAKIKARPLNKGIGAIVVGGGFLDQPLSSFEFMPAAARGTLREFGLTNASARRSSRAVSGRCRSDWRIFMRPMLLQSISHGLPAEAWISTLQVAARRVWTTSLVENGHFVLQTERIASSTSAMNRRHAMESGDRPSVAKKTPLEHSDVHGC
jgi:hypothetical protein